MISWRVVGHVKREREAKALAWALDAGLDLDDGTYGEWANHARAWEALQGTDSEWSVVVQDDALPVPEIAAQSVQALSHVPELVGVVSFYLGTSYPPQTVPAFRRARDQADHRDVPWIVTKRLFWGVAVAVRTETIGHMLHACKRMRFPYDERLSRWAESAGHRVGYTWPSLFDHADGESLVHEQGKRSLPRRAYRAGARKRWTRAYVKL